VEGLKESAVEMLEVEHVRRHDEIKGLATTLRMAAFVQKFFLKVFLALLPRFVLSSFLLLLLLPHQPMHLHPHPRGKLGFVQR